MNDGFRLSIRAEGDIADMLDWTFQRFGPEQAVRYHRTILDRIAAAVRDEIPLRRLDRVTGNAGHAVLAQLRAAEHIVILKPTKPDWLVLSILHGRSDLARRLNEIENEG